MLSVANVTKSYGSLRALDGVDLDVEAGVIHALLGPNGAGKTTLHSIIAGLIHADSGVVTIGGFDVRDDPRAVRRLTGLAPQDLGIYPRATVAENLRLFAHLHGVPGRAVRAKVDWVSEVLGLTHLLRRRAGSMSGGEQRRLHTAIAVIGEPKLLLLDEPTVGADAETRARLVEFVKERREQGTAIVYSTHYFPEVEALDAEVSVLTRGKVAARGTPSELVALAGSAFVDVHFSDGAPNIADVLIVARGPTWMRFGRNGAAPDIREVMDVLRDELTSVTSIDVIRPTFEAAYVRLTQEDG